MKYLYPVLCFILVGMLYVGCNEDFPTQSAPDTEQVAVADAIGGVMLADKGKPGSGGDSGGGGATYRVDIDIVDIGGGTATGVPGSTSRGVSIGEGDMFFTPLFPDAFGCPAVDDVAGTLDGLFALVLVQNKQSKGEDYFTYAGVNFFGFTGTDTKAYGIKFDAVAGQFLLSNWNGLATGPVTQNGSGFVLEGPRNSPCNGDPFTNEWTITVTPE